MENNQTTRSLDATRILIIDDHDNIRLSLKLTLENEGAFVSEASSYSSAISILDESINPGNDFPFGMILLDIRLPDGNGLELLKLLSTHNLASRVIMISGEGTATEAFQATQIGAFDYIEKPFNSERILVSVSRCLDFNKIQSDNQQLQKQILRGQEIKGSHASVTKLRKIIAQVAPTKGRVLILGESGTGKELIAKAIHRESPRNKYPFIKVNCAAIPHSLVESELFGHEKGAFTGATKNRKGLFEQADKGTLFLDEIGELQPDIQAKLLRVLQSGEINHVGSEQTIHVDVRILAATHRDLEEMIKSGEFREDLFYRLNVVTIQSPSLRERGEDITLLAEHFLNEACEEHSIGFRQLSQSALSQLSSYHWPGNIRELRNIIERTVILSESQMITHIEDLDEIGSSSPTPSHQINYPCSTKTQNEESNIFAMEIEMLPWQEFHAKTDKAYLKFILDKTTGNVSEAARILCLERAYLHRLMKKLGIHRRLVVMD